MRGWSLAWVAVVLVLGVAGEARAQVGTATTATATRAPGREAHEIAEPGDMPGAPRIAPVVVPVDAAEPAPGVPAPAAEPVPPPAPPPSRVAEPAPASEPLPAEPSGLPLAAIRRPIVLPSGVVALWVRSSARTFSREVPIVPPQREEAARYALVPSVAVGLGGGWDATLIGPGVTWLDIPGFDGAAVQAIFGDAEAPEPVQPVLAIDRQLYRESIEVVAGARLALPLFEPRLFSAALNVRARSCPMEWLGLELGAELRAFDLGPFYEGVWLAGDLSAGLTAQLGSHVALSLGTELVVEELPTLDFTPIGRPERVSAVTVIVPLTAGVEVALGTDQVWGVVGLALTIPELVSSADEQSLVLPERFRGTLWLGVYL